MLFAISKLLLEKQECCNIRPFRLAYKKILDPKPLLIIMNPDPVREVIMELDLAKRF